MQRLENTASSSTKTTNKKSMNIQFNKFHWSFITVTITMTNTSFNIVSRGLWQLFTEPGSRHPGWVAQLTEGRRRTPFTIPEWLTIEARTSSTCLRTLTEEVVSHKGRDTCYGR